MEREASESCGGIRRESCENRLTNLQNLFKIEGCLRMASELFENRSWDQVMCEAKSMIRVHSGARRDFEPEISQVIPDVVP